MNGKQAVWFEKQQLFNAVVGDFAQVALMFELLQYYSSQEKYRDLCESAIN